MAIERNMTMNKLGERIKQLRESLVLSQAEFAGKLGVCRTTIQNWERGDIPPPANYIAHLCAKQNVCANWLLLGVGEMRGKAVSDE